jgi:hypothetical protein
MAFGSAFGHNMAFGPAFGHNAAFNPAFGHNKLLVTAFGHIKIFKLSKLIVKYPILITINGFVGLVGLIGFIGHISLIHHNGLFGFGLDNHNYFVDIFGRVGIGFISLNCLVGQISFINS